MPLDIFIVENALGLWLLLNYSNANINITSKLLTKFYFNYQFFILGKNPKWCSSVHTNFLSSIVDEAVITEPPTW